jgi:hypothetical protein
MGKKGTISIASYQPPAISFQPVLRRKKRFVAKRKELKADG